MTSGYTIERDDLDASEREGPDDRARWEPWIVRDAAGDLVGAFATRAAAREWIRRARPDERTKEGP